MLELWQTEWCPSSRRIRERLTELGIDYVIHQVPAEREQRASLEQATRARSIPALVADGGDAVVGEGPIRRYLDERFSEPPGAAAHQARAERVRQRYLQEECG